MKETSLVEICRMCKIDSLHVVIAQICPPKQESEHTYANTMEVSESRICRQDLQMGSSVMNEDVLVFYVSIQRSN